MQRAVGDKDDKPEGAAIASSNSGGGQGAEVIEDRVTGYVLPEPVELDRFVMLWDRLLRSPERRGHRKGKGRSCTGDLAWQRHRELVERDLRDVAAGERVSR